MRDEHLHVEHPRRVRFIACRQEVLEHHELRVVTRRCAARAKDARGVLVSPVVEDVRQEVRIRSVRHALEEAAARELAPVGNACSFDRRSRVGDHVLEVEEHTAQMRHVLQQRQENPPGAAADVDDLVDVLPVDEERRLAKRDRRVHASHG